MAAGLTIACGNEPTYREIPLNINGMEWVASYDGQRLGSLKGGRNNRYCFHTAPRNQSDCADKQFSVQMDGDGIMIVDTLITAQLSADKALERRIIALHQK